MWQLVFTLPAFLIWVTIVLNGATHAVNMTDGLDGLAPGLAAIATGAFGVFAYVIGRVDTSAYLGLFYLPGSGELTVPRRRDNGRVSRLPLVQTPSRPR